MASPKSITLRLAKDNYGTIELGSSMKVNIKKKHWNDDGYKLVSFIEEDNTETEVYPIKSFGDVRYMDIDHEPTIFWRIAKRTPDSKIYISNDVLTLINSDNIFECKTKPLPEYEMQVHFK